MSGDLISRNDAIEALVNLTCYGIEEMRNLCESSVADSEGWLGGIRDAVDEIEAIPSAEPERSRKFLEIVVEYHELCTYPEYEGKPYYAIKYEEKGEIIIGFGTYKPEVLSQYLREYFLPSAEPERRKGKWEDSGWKIIYRCSECGNYLDFSGLNAGRGDANFCPNCGSEMKK